MFFLSLTGLKSQKQKQKQSKKTKTQDLKRFEIEECRAKYKQDNDDPPGTLFSETIYYST